MVTAPEAADDDERQLAVKAARWRDLMVPFDAPVPTIFPSPSEHYRLRAEFRLWQTKGERHYAMFAAGDKRTPILLEQFPAASTRINALMPLLKIAWQTTPTLSTRLFQVEFLSTLAGDALMGALQKTEFKVR